MNIERLSNRVREIKLFSSLGAKIEDPSIARIDAWDEWPGPEAPEVERIGTRQQSFHDDTVSSSEEEDWNQALRTVVEVASKLVPYVESEDAWYAPNIAVWSAAWAFSLEELYVSRGAPVPDEIEAQLHWYERGHWPCALVAESGRSAKNYVVY